MRDAAEMFFSSFKCLLLASSIVIALSPDGAHASPNQHLQTHAAQSDDQGLVGFYRSRTNRPLWTQDGRNFAAARQVTDILRGAAIDGMDDGEAWAARVDAAIAKAASGGPAELAAADLLLSRAWVSYVQTLRRPVAVGMIYAVGTRSPAAPFTAQILTDAANASDLAEHVRRVSALNPIYSKLRAGIVASRRGDDGASVAGLDQRHVAQKLQVNLDRARALPLPDDGTFILVDAASARMFLYRDGHVRDSMRVVVGKADEATPMVAGMIENAVLNPYWNVPPDLVRKRAAMVLKDGVGVLQGKGFELLSDWSAGARLLDARSVDWSAVAAGTKDLRMRQRPGPGNAMGAMKFTFPNDLGIYLHDTPDKSIFAQANRNLSSGCVRVEDAKRLAGWLFREAPQAKSIAPEQIVALPKAMPVVVTYMTATWDGNRFAFAPDPYSRDRDDRRLAAAGRSFAAGSVNR